MSRTGEEAGEPRFEWGEREAVGEEVELLAAAIGAVELKSEQAVVGGGVRRDPGCVRDGAVGEGQEARAVGFPGWRRRLPGAPSR